MDNFNIEKQYQFYLNKMGLKEMNMHPEQKKQLRETFFGASGIMLLLLRDEVSHLPEKQAIKVVQNMVAQVQNFYAQMNLNLN